MRNPRQPPPVDVRRAADRFVTEAPDRTTRHSFSFDRHYDPGNVGFGHLLCHNEDLLRPGGGYPAHEHRDVEIVTWVLAGVLRHQDSTGHSGLVRPGEVQRLSAGRGVLHTETNGGQRGEPVHFVQTWLGTDDPGLPPQYAHVDVGAALDAGGWVTLASGRPDHAGTAAVGLRNRAAALHAVRLPAAASAPPLPRASLLHVFVTRGAVRLVAGDRSVALGAGDAARLTVPADALTATDRAEVLLWEMHRVPA